MSATNPTPGLPRPPRAPRGLTLRTRPEPPRPRACGSARRRWCHPDRPGQHRSARQTPARRRAAARPCAGATCPAVPGSACGRPRHGLRRPRSGTAQSSTISVDNPLHSPASSAPGLAPTRCAKKWRRILKAYSHGAPLRDPLPARSTLAALPHHAPATTRPRPCRRAGVAATAIHAISIKVQKDIQSISNRDFLCGDAARSDSTAGHRAGVLGRWALCPARPNSTWSD